MCGIAGIVAPKGLLPQQLHEMSTLLKHRGPDDEGFTLWDGSDRFYPTRAADTIAAYSHLDDIRMLESRARSIVGLLHRRLSVIDLSPAGHQPMVDEHARVAITYNGEIYNYRELKCELEGLGYSFASSSDTEVILKAYCAWGKACVQKFEGMWAFAILDARKGLLWLSRDRFGIKPLYYTYKSGCLVFASEIKALFALDFVGRQAHLPSIHRYLTYGAGSDSAQTLFAEVVELLPGFNLVCDCHEVKIELHKYYDLESRDNNSMGSDRSRDNPLQAYERLLRRSVELHLRADVAVGSCLSGGLDSSAIVAFAAPRMNGGGFKTFTATYQDADIDESAYAQAVTAHFGNLQPYSVTPTLEQYWQSIDSLIWHQDLPIASTSMFAQWEVMREASRQQIKVLLDGQGADESLGGYSYFAGHFLLTLLRQRRFAAFHAQARRLKLNRSLHVWNEVGRAGFYRIPAWLQRLVHAEKRLGSKFLAREFKQDFKYPVVPSKAAASFREVCIQSIKSGLRELLRYEDRNSMAFSIESRVPFLDHRLIEFTLALPDHWKIRDGWTKYILRKTIENHLPKEVVWRKDKKGFVTPQKAWKEQLAGRITTYLRETEIPSILHRQSLVQLTTSEISDPTHLSEYWRMFSFLKWSERFRVTF